VFSLYCALFWLIGVSLFSSEASVFDPKETTPLSSICESFSKSFVSVT
ncbi:unnamed protein product, partial [Brassica oleracea var. botrytis]